MIKIENLRKNYGLQPVLQGVNLHISAGEFVMLVGTNGAGKSTTMMILATLLKPTSGNALVSGYDVTTHPTKVRQNIGYVQQETTVDEYLTGRENLILQARLNHIPKDQINKRIDTILELIELSDKQNDPVVTYSGGMRKRLDIAGGLLHHPKVLFLDEPTVGLDIQTRRKIWEYVKKLHSEFEMTIFLTTHYMEEADQLCDRIGIIDCGKIQVIDSPQNMKNSMGNEVLTLYVQKNDSRKYFISELKQLEDISKINEDDDRLTLFVSKGADTITEIFRISSALDVKINSLSLKQPTLDDVFISYTGHEMRDDDTFNRRREHAKMKRLRA